MQYRKKRAFALNKHIEHNQSKSFRTEVQEVQSVRYHQAGLIPALKATFAATLVVSVLFAQKVAAAGAPVIEPLRDVYLSEGQTATITVKATDSDGDPLSLAATRRPVGSSFTDNGDGTASFTWEADFTGPYSSDGSPFTVVFAASDGFSVTSQVMKIYVQNVNRAPIVTVPDTVSVEVGDTVRIYPTVLDPDYDSIIWSAPGSPVGATLRNTDGSAPVELQWVPAKDDSGANTITLMATDQWGLSTGASSVVAVSVGPEFAISVAIDTAFPGEVVSLPVSLKNRQPVSGFSLELHYDASVMTFISARTDSARVSSFESFTFLTGVPSPGDLLFRGVADLPDSSLTAPLPAGDGPLFYLNFFVSSQNTLAGLFLPVGFNFGPFDPVVNNTLTDATGATITSDSIVFSNGGVKVKNQSSITRGDINLNGVPFEVGDALRFTNYFINPVTFGFNAEQFANSDINSDGIVASVADFVTLLSIVVGDGSSSPRISYGDIAPVTVIYDRSSENLTQSNIIRFVTDDVSTKVGAALLTFVVPSGSTLSSFEIDSDIMPAGYKVLYHQTNDTLRALLYNPSPVSVQSGSLAGLTEVRFSAVNSQGESEALELVAVESASAQGAPVQTELAKTGSVSLPETFELSQNYPNPFNPETQIHYALSVKSEISLVVYDILGRKVTTLAQGAFDAGEYVARWDGRNSDGSPVASGMYFYRLTANGKALSRKMTLLK